MDATRQLDLFEQDTPPPEVVQPPPISASLYADVVFDAPLNQPYTYAVPDRLLREISVGKRVQAPFGRGERAAVGYCVRIQNRGPDRAVKALYGILDREPLLTSALLGLTRWMADYYFCGWGQVLSAVLPAGVRQQAG